MILEEWVDILDASGNYTGTSRLKSEAHKLGLFHPTIHVWCYAREGALLLQQRSANKETFPLKWDVSVAGHVEAGEELITAAVREVQEEIGVAIVQSGLEKIGIFKTEKRHSHLIWDREFTHAYLYEMPMDTVLTKQDTEVEALQWLLLSEFERWINEHQEKLVPNSRRRHETVIAAIRSRL